MGYGDGMSNTQALNAPSPEEMMRARGTALRDMLRNERWSNRAAAQHLGLTHTYVGARLNGEVDLSYSDIESFARLLNMKTAELFMKLPGLDSNQEPIGSRLAPISSLSGRTPKVANPSPKRTPAVVSLLKVNA
jgi:transcriptional regulator with XRE-family HTH domain